MICPKHDCELLPPDDKQWRGKLLICPVKGCNTHQVLTARQKKLPGMDPGKQSNAIRISEVALMRQGSEWGALRGYEVLEIGQKVQYPKCTSCHKTVKRILCPYCMDTFTPALYSTNTPGTPDTFWGHRDWNNWWKAVEWKAHEHAPVRTEQKRLIELGVSGLAWSLETLQALLG